jgi:hypothetical protein
MWRIGVLSIALVSSCFATSSCPDSKMRQAIVGGDSISGVVLLNGKTLKSALVRLNSVRGKFARGMTRTDENGKFTLHKIAPGKYFLNVHGWGTTSIQVSPKADRNFIQRPNWWVILTDNECVSVGAGSD